MPFLPVPHVDARQIKVIINHWILLELIFPKPPLDLNMYLWIGIFDVRCLHAHAHLEID